MQSQIGRQTCIMSMPKGATLTKLKRGAFTSRVRPMLATPDTPSAPITTPAENTINSSTSPAVSKDAANEPPPSQNTRVMPLVASVVRT